MAHRVVATTGHGRVRATARAAALNIARVANTAVQVGRAGRQVASRLTARAASAVVTAVASAAPASRAALVVALADPASSVLAVPRVAAKTD
jgi:hypothetical protein